MNNGASFNRVKALLNKLPTLPAEGVKSRAKDIKNDIHNLFGKLERLHSLYPELKQVDLSNDIYSLAKRL
jgi:archaellum component FlaC